MADKEKTPQKDLFKGYTVGKYRPHHFLHRGIMYEWKNLTRKQVEFLGNDPKFNEITKIEQKK